MPKICIFFINAGLTPLLLNNVKKLLYRTTSLSVTVASVATTFTHTANNWPSPWWHQTLLLLLDHQRWRPPRRLIPQAANVANPSSSGHQLQPPRPILSPPAKSLQRYPPPPSPSRWSNQGKTARLRDSSGQLSWKIFSSYLIKVCLMRLRRELTFRRPASSQFRKS